MRKNKEIVNLSDIVCAEIVKDIKECTRIIYRFVGVLNNHLDYDELKEPQIFIIREKIDVYEDDGNTQTEGYKYIVYWCFPYINVDDEVSISRICNSSIEMWPHNLLFFKYESVERITDNSYNSGRFFALYVTEEPKRVTSNTCIASYNDNYKLKAMLSFENLQICINRINETYKRLRLKEALLEELCSLDEIPNIDKNIVEYIDRNCKKRE